MPTGLVLIAFVCLGVRAGVLAAGLRNLVAVPFPLPPEPYVWMALHLAGTVAAAVFVFARSRPGIAVSAAFVIYSTVSLVLDDISGTGRLLLSLAGAGFLGGLVAVWLAHPVSPGRRRVATELGVFAVAAIVTFALY